MMLSEMNGTKEFWLENSETEGVVRVSKTRSGKILMSGLDSPWVQE